MVPDDALVMAAQRKPTTEDAVLRLDAIPAATREAIAEAVEAGLQDPPCALPTPPPKTTRSARGWTSCSPSSRAAASPKA